MNRCPECHKDDLQQQLSQNFFNCLNCGKWFKLFEVSINGKSVKLK